MFYKKFLVSLISISFIYFACEFAASHILISATQRSHNIMVLYNCRQTKLHNIGATVVGVDKFGNKYYEKLGDTQYGGHFFLTVYYSVMLY